MNDIALVLSGGAVGAVFTMLTGWVTANVAASKEHRQWIRQQRFEAYTGYLESCSEMLTNWNNHDDDVYLELMRQHIAWRTKCLSLAPPNRSQVFHISSQNFFIDPGDRNDVAHKEALDVLDNLQKHIAWNFAKPRH